MKSRKVLANLIRALTVTTLRQTWPVWSLNRQVLSNYYRRTISLSRLSVTHQAFTKFHIKLPLRLITRLLIASRYSQLMKVVTQELRSLTKMLWMTLTLVILAAVLVCIGHPHFHQIDSISTFHNKVKSRSNWTCKTLISSIIARSTTFLIIQQIVEVCTPRVISSRHSRRPRPSYAKLQQSHLSPPHRQQEATQANKVSPSR